MMMPLRLKLVLFVKEWGPNPKRKYVNNSHIHFQMIRWEDEVLRTVNLGAYVVFCVHVG